MHCGTTSDTFLRNNLEWLARATNWAKFTATASLGVIHKVITDFFDLKKRCGEDIQYIALDLNT